MVLLSLLSTMDFHPSYPFPTPSPSSLSPPSSLPPPSLLTVSRCEVAVLRRNAQLQAKEANHVKLLAKQLLDKRTDVEEFFITALTEVRQRAKETQ